MRLGAYVFPETCEKNCPHFGKYFIVRESKQQVLGKYSARLLLNAPILQEPYNELKLCKRPGGT